MCKYCFENEYTRFKNEELSNETDLRISSLLSTKVLEFVEEIKYSEKRFSIIMKFINADIVIRNGLIPLQTYTGEVFAEK